MHCRFGVAGLRMWELPGGSMSPCPALPRCPCPCPRRPQRRTECDCCHTSSSSRKLHCHSRPQGQALLPGGRPRAAPGAAKCRSRRSLFQRVARRSSPATSGTVPMAGAGGRPMKNADSMYLGQALVPKAGPPTVEKADAPAGPMGGSQ